MSGELHLEPSARNCVRLTAHQMFARSSQTLCLILIVFMCLEGHSPPPASKGRGGHRVAACTACSNCSLNGPPVFHAAHRFKTNAVTLVCLPLQP
eukprot:6008059-Amphidinium_carterae.1